MKLSTPVSAIPFVGDVYAKRLLKLNITTVGDLIHHYPSRYDDLSDIRPIFSVQPGETVTISGKIVSIKNDMTKFRKQIQRAVIEDETGSIEAVWFNQPYLAQSLKKDEMANFSGRVSQFGFKRSLQSPEYEVVKPNVRTIHTGRIVPVYPETYGVSSKWLRSRIAPLLHEIKYNLSEFIPDEIIKRYELIDFLTAIFHIHFPDSKEMQMQARERLAFNELFLIQLSSQLRKKTWQKEVTGTQLRIKNYELRIKEFINKLPFKLTLAQQRAIDDIVTDLENDHPMNRLLQGDVGSGKTIVAAVASYVTYLNGYTTVFMAPTEILAQQHHSSLSRLFAPYDIPVEIVTSTTKKKFEEKKSNSASPRIIVGTHALLFQDHIDKIALVIIDEQHRFGVAQRTKLREMGIYPHLLSMTATPIPRSVALIVHSELELSYIDEMPLGRKRVKTWLVPNEKREKAYQWIKSEIQRTTAERRNQAFIICPLIEESEHETMKSVKSAKVEYEKLQHQVFTDLSVTLIHGKMKAAEKQKVLDDFAAGESDILVATPVVEVGIDIPNATIIMIEAAERFGLSQLHQLRGRVGRSQKQSYCLLFTESESETSIKRLKSLETVYNGAQLSEIDLMMRGPGQLYGTRQHGFSTFKIARFNDHILINRAKEAAIWILENKSPLPPRLQNELQPYIIQSVNPD